MHRCCTEECFLNFTNFQRLVEIELQGFFSMLFVNALRADDCQRAHFSITTVLLFVVQPWLNMDVESCALDSVDADILLLMSQAKEKQDANTGCATR